MFDSSALTGTRYLRLRDRFWLSVGQSCQAGATLVGGPYLPERGGSEAVRRKFGAAS